MTNQQLAHRMATIKIRVTDAQGAPMANTVLDLRQTSHEFLFGCGAFDAMPYVNPEDENQFAFFKDRMQKWLALYNYGTLPFYWGNFERTEGNPETELLMKAARYLQENGVVVKGHPLCWHTVCADWLLQYDNREILKKQLARIDREVTNFTGVIDMWDVINEVVIMPIFDKYDNAVTRICNDLGQVGIVREMFAKAKEANPNAILLINDFNTSPAYEKLISDCLDAGIPIDVIGIQSHQHQGYWGAEKLEHVLERFEKFGLPIHFTENTLVSGELIPPEIEDLNDFQVSVWPSTPEGEERQMRQTEEMYRILFAHPQVKAVTGWDFSDGNWLNAPSGVIHKDGSVKPVYEKLLQMVKGEWWTKGEVRTDENGFATVSGFKGTYELAANRLSADIRLSDDTTELQVMMK